MELYNSLIKDTKAFFDGKNPQRWSYNERDCWTDLGSSELVLQKDAAYELGVSAMFSTDRAALSVDKLAGRTAADYEATLRDVLRLVRIAENIGRRT